MDKRSEIERLCGHDYDSLLKKVCQQPNYGKSVQVNVTSAARTQFALSKDRLLTYSKFQGKDYVHIRVYGRTKTTPPKLFPTKKGIALTPKQFVSLIYLFDYIDRIFDDSEKPENKNHEPYRIHISGLVYVWITPGMRCIHLRYAYKKDGKILPSKFKVCII